MKKVLVILAFSVFIFPFHAIAQSWSTEVNVRVSKTLVKNNIKGCGQMRWRDNLGGEFIVQCAPDGEYTHEYLVFAAIEKVEGPFHPGTAD